jgi:LmbE family N-acetylglucosaminyl deacetylase
VIDALRPPVPAAWCGPLAEADRWAPPDVTTVVVVPHPDDEAVMFGGLLAHLAGRGTDVEVVAVTDGGAAYPEHVPCHALEQTRREEQRDAMDALGLRRAAVTRLGIPDGDVAAYEGEITDAISQIVRDRQVGMIVTPWEFDHHTDHEACGRAAVGAARKAEAPITIAAGVFWALLREAPPAGTRMAALHLTVSERLAKAHAIRCHRSQVDPGLAVPPVLTAVELAVARWSREHYLVHRVH